MMMRVPVKSVIRKSTAPKWPLVNYLLAIKVTWLRNDKTQDCIEEELVFANDIKRNIAKCQLSTICI